MDSLDKLIKEIESNSLVERFKQLEKIIDSDQLLNQDYKELLELQKIMVNKREKKSKDFKLAENNYNNAKDNVLKHMILSEYLDLLEEINYDLNMIQKIISEEINIDFK